MKIRDRLATGLPTDRLDVPPLLSLFVVVPTALGAAHHVDHIVRGNHVGWPLAHEVTPFTYSLAIYPIIAVGLWLTATDRVGAGFWAGVFAASTAMLAYFHVSPWAVEPPADVIDPYASPVVGSLAFGVLLALIASVLLGTAYAAHLRCRRGA